MDFGIIAILGWLQESVATCLLSSFVCISPYHESMLYPVDISLLVRNTKKVFNLESCWDVLSCCTEYIHRSMNLALGKETPYVTKMNRLNAKCTAQYCQRKLQIAKKQFYKCISARAATLLLSELDDEFYETKDEKVEQSRRVSQAHFRRTNTVQGNNSAITRQSAQ